jgi:release factor glutamine methyltransferase
MTTILARLQHMTDRFAAAGIETPDLDARLLVQHTLELSTAGLMLKSNDILTEPQQKLLQTAEERRLKREPVSRILGRRGFWKYDFKITPETLDPRPDSETLVEAALGIARPPPKRLLDLGTGTGCLLLSLLGEWPETQGVGLDIAPGAVATAQENARATLLADRARFECGDWRDFTPSEPFDMVVSNPPYIPEAEIAALAPEVSVYDPRGALAGGADGLDCYRSIAACLKKLLRPGGWLLLEIGHDQAAAVKSILAAAGAPVVDTRPDLAGSDRVIIARRPDK